MEREKPVPKVIKTMPDQATLEAYLNSFPRVRVSFNILKGEFEWLEPRKDVLSVQAEPVNSSQERTIPGTNS